MSMIKSGLIRKTSNYSGKSKFEIEKVKLQIPLTIWNLLVKYLFSESELVNLKAMANLKKMMNLCDISEYENNFEIQWRIQLINVVIKGFLNNISDIELLKNYCVNESDSIYKKNIKDFFNTYNLPISLEDLSDDDVLFLSNYVLERIKYIHIFKNAPKLKNVLNELDYTDQENISVSKINNKVEEVINTLYVDMNKAKTISKAADMDFSLGDELSALNAFKNTIDELNKPNNHLNSGIKYLNNMLDGGFENGRLYLFFGLPKSFKSALLLNLCIQVCKNNKDIILKNPNKTPCVFYLTQENSIRETIDRMYTMVTGKSIKKSTPEQALKLIKELVMKQTGIELVIKYRPNKSISTTDFNGMMDDLEAEGKECILAVQDYTKRIRSSENNPDIRLELGTITNDLTVIAKTRNIPVISAGQLNREAMKVLENGLEKNRKDIGKYLNGSHIGESQLMIENTDYAIIINKETLDETDEDFLTFKLIASRAKNPGLIYFAHPIYNGIQLYEDIHDSKTSSLEKLTSSLGEEGVIGFNPNTVSNISSKNMFENVGKPKSTGLNLNSPTILKSKKDIFSDDDEKFTTE